MVPPLEETVRSCRVGVAVGWLVGVVAVVLLVLVVVLGDWVFADCCGGGVLLVVCG